VIKPQTLTQLSVALGTGKQRFLLSVFGTSDISVVVQGKKTTTFGLAG
jgi:hypothetical protein